MPAPTEMVKGHAMLFILSCLAKDSMHGYGIAKEIERTSQNYFTMGEGTLYPHLRRLEQAGFVEGEWQNVVGDRNRKSYKITRKGRAELARLEKEYREFQSNAENILALARRNAR